MKRQIMSYSTGMMDMRVKVAKRATNTQETFGKSGQPKYEWLRQAGDHGLWASEKFDKGMKSLREGAFDAYDTVMFRMRYYKGVDRWCLIQYNGKWYQIQSFNEDYQDNQIQITAIEMANQQVNVVNEE
jgi:head-tail adaptor